MNIFEINKKMFQRPPFQMIDRIIELIPDEYGKGVKNVSVNEPFFQGHFPEFPIMPGVLITEAAAQLCAVVMANGGLASDKLPVLLKIDFMKFINPVIPGDVLIIEVKNTQKMDNFAKFDVTLSVDEKKIANGILMFSFIDKKSFI